jgi:hypothetical protein
VSGDFASRARPALEALLAPGETPDGIVVATHQKTFSGSLYAVGVTDRRVLLQIGNALPPPFVSQHARKLLSGY